MARGSWGSCRCQLVSFCRMLGPQRGSHLGQWYLSMSAACSSSTWTSRLYIKDNGDKEKKGVKEQAAVEQ